MLRTSPVDVRLVVALSAAAMLASAWVTPSAMAQWPQWGGPAHNFQVHSAKLAENWPAQGPQRLWHRELGDGYATIVVDAGRLYTLYRKDGRERTVCLDAASGQTIWEQGHDAAVTDVMREFGEGPHSTPLLVGERLFTVGINGVLSCFETSSGKVRWRHDLAADYGMEVPGRGYSSSPLAYGRTLILPVGGQDGQGLMAFDQHSGQVAWKALTLQLTHSSPLLIEFEGQPQVVYFASDKIVGVTPADGTLLWSQDHPTMYGANLATPAWNGKDILVCSAAYDSGTRCLRLRKQNGKTVPEELWYTKKMRIHHGNLIIADDHVYASSGDFGPAFFMCADLASGRLAWHKRGFAKSTCVSNGNQLIILDEDGNLALATINPTGMTVHARSKVAERYAWAAPTLVDSKLYVRDRQHIMAFDLE